METRYIAQRKANEYVLQNHRHHGKVRGSIFQLGCYVDGELVGVAIVGRPVARLLDKGEICELTRLATNGTKNACSKLYAKCARIAKEYGFVKIITYILESESGVSLRAAGWEPDGTSPGGDWKRNDGERQRVVSHLFGEVEKYPNEPKQRWKKELNPTLARSLGKGI